MDEPINSLEVWKHNETGAEVMVEGFCDDEEGTEIYYTYIESRDMVWDYLSVFRTRFTNTGKKIPHEPDNIFTFGA